jgi:hypothetical protein
MVTMTNPIENSLVKHKHLIMLTIAAAALVAYMLPFDNMLGVADAAKKPKKSYYNKDASSVSRTTIGLAQSAIQNAGILGGGGGGGGGSYDGFQLGNTAFQFLQQSQQVCSGISFCPNTQLVQFQPYTLFGQ